MARESDIREQIAFYTDVLIDLYEKTDPALGPVSEDEKLAHARHAIDVLWRLFDKLVVWAQAHLTGYQMLSNNPELVELVEKKAGREVNENSHELEQLGLVWVFNPPDPDDPELERFVAVLERFDTETLTPHVIRGLIFELMMSHSANSSYWRHDLQHSFRALNEGEADALATPFGGRKQGRPALLMRWKLEAVRQVHYRVGKGMKKYRALEEVGNGIGQSVETLRSWEKELRKSEDYSVELMAGELAGLHEEELSSLPPYKTSSSEYGDHRGTDLIVYARLALGYIRQYDLDVIRERIRQSRAKRAGI